MIPSLILIENGDLEHPADQSSELDTEPLDTSGDSLPDISFDSDVTEFDSDGNIINNHANSIENERNQDNPEGPGPIDDAQNLAPMVTF